jgi:hypothetical protein
VVFRTDFFVVGFFLATVRRRTTFLAGAPLVLDVVLVELLEDDLDLLEVLDFVVFAKPCGVTNAKVAKQAKSPKKYRIGRGLRDKGRSFT